MQLKLFSDFAIKDVFRLWSASQLQVIIIAGICLPILMLLGLKNGHVADLREDLVTSPTGRQVMFWSAKEGDFMTKNVMDSLLKDIPNVDLIIPDVQKLVFVDVDSESAESAKRQASLTLYSTGPGDPILRQFGADIGPPTSGALRSLILQQPTAEALNLKIGDEVVFLIKRRLGEIEEEHAVRSTLTGIVATGSADDGFVGYASVETMAALEKYSTGVAVEELGIPAMPSLRAVDRYNEMLLICFRGPGSDLTAEDHEFFGERGLEAIETTDPEILTLFGNLKENSSEKLKFYKLRIPQARGGGYIRDNPALLTRNTAARDDLALRWCPPLTVEVDGTPVRFVGLTLPTKKQNGGWLQTFLEENAFWFTYEESVENPLVFRGPESSIKNIADHMIMLSPELEVNMDCRNVSEEQADEGLLDNKETVRDGLIEAGVASNHPLPVGGNPNTDEVRTVFVPVSLLAYVEQFSKGDVVFDKLSNRFTPTPQPVAFTKARLYTSTIDDVPLATKELAERRFAVLSEVSRIAEIQEQDGSLQFLVLVVAVGVFIFGVITVFSVLVDSTDRKKGMIGILRVMGVPGPGVFIILLIRAVVIGVMAAGLCCAIGVLLTNILNGSFGETQSLPWLPQIHVVIGVLEYGFITLGAILCASLGVLVPAFKASRLDPFDAIMEGQFN